MNNRLVVRAIAVSLILVVGRAAPLWAAAPIKLNGPLVAGGGVFISGLAFSPDSSRVLYYADQTTNEVFEIFSVPSGGGAATKLNGPLVAGGDVSTGGLAFSPDSSRVLYRADQTTDEVVEIFSVASTGGTATKLNGPLVASGDVLLQQFSPDSSRVLYLADQTTDTVNEIYSVPSAGGAATKLNGPLVAGGEVFSTGFAFSPDSSRVLYLADQTADGVNEIFSVPSAGGTATKLNGPLVAGGNVFSNGLAFSPDSSRVLYRADQTTDEVVEIFSVASAGGAAVKLNGALVAGGNVSSFGLAFSPDSSRVLYLADQTTDEVFEIFSVPSGGGAATKLNGPLVAGGDVFSSGLQFSPDSSRVLYLADQTTDGVNEIFSVPSAGGAATKLNGPLVAGGNVSSASLQFSPDSSRVLYQADQTTDGVFEIFSVASAGGAATKLNGPLVAGGDVFFQQFSPDSSRVLYRADQTTNDVQEIFLVPSRGGTAVKINGPLVDGGTVSGQQFSPDGSRVLYSADQDTNGVNEVYVRVIEAHWNTGSGSWTTNANWNNGFAPDEVMQTVIDQPATVALSGTGRQAFSLAVGGGSGTSILELQANAGLNVSNGMTVDDGGVIRGDGTIAADIFVNAGGEVRATAGDQLRIAGSLGFSDSRIEAIGSAAAPAEIEVDGLVTGEGSVLIAAQNATLRFNSGLYNEGALAVSAGTTTVFGDVDNQGSIVVSGGAVVTFYDDVDQGATLQVSQVGSTTSVAVFLGALTGGGGSTGGGDIFIEGDLQPGNSPALVTFENNVFLGGGAGLEIELGGPAVGSQYDRVVVDGNLALDGTLAVSLINGFTPGVGQSFDVLDWDTLAGAFDTLSLPALSAGLLWNTSQLYTNGVLAVAAALAGDYNGNGVVDAADYTVWRDHLGQAFSLFNENSAAATPGLVDAEDYTFWKSHFGETAGSGAIATARSAPGEPPASGVEAVPEPTAILLALGGFLAGAAKCRRPRRLGLDR
jgi:Tol biopolymer transport system component